MSEISTPFPVEPPTGQPPFSLSAIIASSTICTPLTGGILAAENWRRLGKPQRRIQALLIGLVGLLIVLLANTWFTLNTSDRNIQYAGFLILNALFGVILTTLQRSAYKEWAATNKSISRLQRRSGTLSYIVIVILSIIVVFIFASVLQPAFTGLVEGLHKPHTYIDGGVSFTISSAWLDANSQQTQEPLCAVPNQHCIVLATHSTDDLTTNLIRFSGDAFKALAPKDIDASVWTTILTQYPAAKVISIQALKVDGRDAFQRIYSYNDSGTDRTRLLEFVKEDSGTVVRLDITGSTPTFNQSKSDIDALAGSIHFIASKAT